MRELAPDTHALAPAAALAVAPSQWRASPEQARARALGIGVAMLAARIVTRSTGCAPTAFDYAALAVGALALPRGNRGRAAAVALLGGALAFERLTR